MIYSTDNFPFLTEVIANLRATELKDIKIEHGESGMYLDGNNTWRMECGCTEANVLDNNHNECNTDQDFGAN